MPTTEESKAMMASIEQHIDDDYLFAQLMQRDPCQAVCYRRYRQMGHSQVAALLMVVENLTLLNTDKQEQTVTS